MSIVTPEIARGKPAALQWEDPFLLDQQLSNEERMIKDAAAAYCQDRLQPRRTEVNRHEIFHREIMNEMGELGLLGTAIPEQYGGVVCFGLTEPDHGSDAGGMITRAKSTDGGYLMSGAKNRITNSPIADVFVIWAKSDAHDGKIKSFVLQKDMKGLNAPKIDDKFSLRSSTTGMIQMDEVFVPEENEVFVPEENLLPNVQGLALPASGTDDG